MWKLSDLIGDAEELGPILIPSSTGALPIKSPEDNGWTLREDPARLTKMFSFKDEKSFNTFVIDLLELQAETAHHGRITLQYPKIKIEVWTHHLNDVTEIDLEWATAVNDIFEGYDHE
jgi:4a-hydroxytetrahydrobiopterin dehydratase